MDPISITSAVVSTIATCLSTAKKLYDLQEKYKDAPVVVVSIYSESNVILASLAQMQMLLLQKQTLSDMPAELPGVLDQAVTGCMVVFSCLELEVQRMGSGASQPTKFPWRARVRFVWNEIKLNELLGALRGQQAAVNLFLQLLQMRALGDIKTMLDNQKDTVQTSAHITQSLRSKNPSITVASSIYGDRDRSIDAASVVAPSELEFAFDDVVINSQAYRRVLAQAEAQTKATVDGASASTPTAVEFPKEGFISEMTTKRLLSRREELEGEEGRLGLVALPFEPRSPVRSSEATKKAQYSGSSVGPSRIPRVPRQASNSTWKAQHAQQPSGFVGLAPIRRESGYTQRKLAPQLNSFIDVPSIRRDHVPRPSVYMSQGFDPWQLTEEQLRGILFEEQKRLYPATTAKSELVARVHFLIAIKEISPPPLDFGIGQTKSDPVLNKKEAEGSEASKSTNETTKNTLLRASPVQNQDSAGKQLRAASAPDPPGPVLSTPVSDSKDAGSNRPAADEIHRDWRWDFRFGQYRHKQTGEIQSEFPRQGDEYPRPENNTVSQVKDRVTSSPATAPAGPSVSSTPSTGSNDSSSSVTITKSLHGPLPDDWEWDHDGVRWFYRYKPTGYVQYEFPASWR